MVKSQSQEKKISRQSLDGEIPEGWKEFCLRDAIDIKHGFAFKGKFFSDKPTENILLTPGNFRIGGGFKADKFKYYWGEYPEEYVLQKDDIIITMTDLSKKGDTLGYPAKVPSSNGTRYLHNQRLGLVKFKHDRLDKNFLYWLLRTRKYQGFIVNSASGSTVKHTSPSRIREYGFLAPSSLKEQRAIAKILSDLDEKIELNHRMNKTLEAIAQAIFKRWFVDFNFPNENGRPYKSSGGRMVDSKAGDIPEGWRVGSLEEIIRIESGKRPGEKSEIKSQQFSIPLIGASSVMGYVRDCLYAEPILIIGRVGTHGIVQRVSYPSFPSDNTLVIKPDYFEFTHQILKTIDYESLNVGTTQPLITQTSIKNYSVILPDPNLLKNYENAVSGLFQKVEKNIHENDALIQIRDSLLPKLMSGEVRVNGGNTIVEGVG